MIYEEVFRELQTKSWNVDPAKKDYTYDIPEEDLRRYRKLRPQEILRWLQDINEFRQRAALSHSPIVSDDVRKPGE